MANKLVTELDELTTPIATDQLYIIDDPISTPIGKKINVSTLLQAGLQMVSAPAAADSTGTAGQLAYDSSYLYVCIATNTWVRTELATWS